MEIEVFEMVAAPVLEHGFRLNVRVRHPCRGVVVPGCIEITDCFAVIGSTADV